VKRSSREGRPADIRSVYRRVFWRRARAAEEESEPEHASAQVESFADEASGAAVTTRPFDLAGLEQAPASRRDPAVGPRGAPARAAQRVSQPPPQAERPAPPAQEWNLWDLERRARQHAGQNPRAEEWSALFTHLRVFANADGVLPKQFDGLVRESFGQLIEAA
jgi:hypothetical protein